MGFFVEVREVLAAGLGVLFQVVIGAVGDALQFRPSPGEPVLNVVAVLGVMGQFVLAVAAQPQVLAPDTQVHVPLEAVLDPPVQPFLVGARFHEELHLHLLELPGAEGEVAGGDLVPERLADLADAEGQLLACRVEHVFEIDEDALGGLRPQKDLVGRVFHRAHEGLEHQVEAPRFRQLAAAIGAAQRFKRGFGLRGFRVHARLFQ